MNFAWGEGMKPVHVLRYGVPADDLAVVYKIDVAALRTEFQAPLTAGRHACRCIILLVEGNGRWLLAPHR